MPGRNGSGPVGQGPMTGRGFGNCTGVNNNAYGYRVGMGRRAGFGMGSGMGRRSGFGMGSGIGRGVGYGAFYNEVPFAGLSQKDFLANQKAILDERLEIINSQLENLSEDEK